MPLVDYSFILLPVGLLILLRVGAKHHISSTDSWVQTRKDRKRVSVCPNIPFLRERADNANRYYIAYGSTPQRRKKAEAFDRITTRYGCESRPASEYRDAFESARDSLVAARREADSLLRQRSRRRHLSSSS